MTILDKILKAKQTEVAARKEVTPTKRLEQSLYYPGKCVSFSEYMRRTDLLGVIAEIKRRSPSKGAINEYISVEELSIGYMQAGASALSVLTDEEFFGGSLKDLGTARESNFCPILRKDFIIDEYQIVEAKSFGADLILLIAAALSTEKMKRFGEFAHSLGLEVLVEVHSEEELHTVPFECVDAVGVNNRDLKTFTVDIETSRRLLPGIPSEKIKISESGIATAEDLVSLKRDGFNGFLIGERFMQENRPQDACRVFIDECTRLLGESSR